MLTLPPIPLPIVAMFTGYAPHPRATYEIICSGHGTRLAVHSVLRFTKRRMRPEEALLQHYLGRPVRASDLRDSNELVVTGLGVFSPVRALEVLLDAAQEAWYRGVGHPDVGVFRYCFVSPDTHVIRASNGYAPDLPNALRDDRLPPHPQLWQAPTRRVEPDHASTQLMASQHPPHDLSTLPIYYHRLAATNWLTSE